MINSREKDKYNNQEPKATIFIDTENIEERYGTQLYIEYLEKYKNAWEELKNTTIFTESYPREHKMNEYYKDVFGELEQKYNLGTNNKEGD